MIKIIRGVYGKREGVQIVRVNKNSAPFELPEAEEKRLVALGFAEYVKPEAATPAAEPEGKTETPQGEAAPATADDGEIDFEEMTVAQLRTYAEQNGIDLKSNLPKAKVIEAIKAATAQ